MARMPRPARSVTTEAISRVRPDLFPRLGLLATLRPARSTNLFVDAPGAVALVVAVAAPKT
jgi:hypothetical protein